MTGRPFLGILGFLLQLVPLAILAFWMWAVTKPVDNPSGLAGVASFRPLGTWYAYPLSIALGLSCLVAIFSRIAAIAAAVLTLAALTYGLRLWLPNNDPLDGPIFVGLAALSLVGWAMRMVAWQSGKPPISQQRETPESWPVRVMLAFAIVGPPALVFLLSAMQPHTMMGPSDWPLGVDTPFLAIGAGVWLAGVIWMIRIFRGLSDDPPPWRYRDR
jgi:hypothetical protein